MQIPLSQCTTLLSALQYRTALGACFIRSFALMLDLPGATLVFGVVKPATPEELAREPRSSTVPFVHAWVEYRGSVFAPTLIERSGSLRSFSRDEYYLTNGVTSAWRLEHRAFMLAAKRFKLASAFKHCSKRAGNGDIVEAMLRAAKVSFRISEQRTILPAQGS